MTDPFLEKSVLSQLLGRRVYLHSSDREVPICVPTLRRGSNRFLKPRKLRIINAVFLKRFLKVAGSPWLPGLWVLDPVEAHELVSSTDFDRPALFMSVTTAPVQEKNWYSFKGEPLMIFDATWPSGTDYVQGMKKKYRARFNKVHSTCGHLEIKEAAWSDSLKLKAATMLSATLEDKVAVLPDNLEELLGQFQQWFGSAFKIFGAFEDERLLAFITLVEDGTTLRAMHYGALDDAPPEVYSRLMFHAIAMGIEGPFDQVNLGRTGTEIKSTYGATPNANYFSFYTKNPLLRWILKLVQNRYVPKSFELRSPFKQDVREPSLESV